jgi:hypothetical protein
MKEPLEPLMTLKEIVPLLRCTLKSAQHACRAGRFPIRFVAERPYRFAPADVRAYVERGVVSNPLRADRRRKFFQSAQRAKLKAAS